MEKNPGTQRINSNLIDQSQDSINKQELRIKKRQIYSCQGLGNFELPSKLKKLEKFHEQENFQLYSLIEKMNTEIQTPKTENQNLKFLCKIKKGRQRLGKFSLVQIEALTSNLVLIEKNHAANPQKIEEKFQLQIKNLTRKRQDGN